MLAKIKAKFEAFCLWVYEWVTVLAAILAGAPDIILGFIAQFDGIDLAPVLGAETALKVVVSVAIIKGLMAFIASRQKPV